MLARFAGWLERAKSRSAAARMVSDAGGDYQRLTGEQLGLIRDNGTPDLRAPAVEELERRERRLGERRRQRRKASEVAAPPEGTRCSLCSAPADVYSTFVVRGERTPVCTPCLDREFPEMA